MKIDNLKFIKYILENDYSTSDKIASFFNISTRTVRNYVKNINSAYPNTIISTNNGYTINKDNIHNIINNKGKMPPQHSQERISYILNELLQLEPDSFLSLYEMCDELFISYSTLKNELTKIKNKLSSYNLTLDIVKDQITLCGDEYDKRKLINDLLYEESSNNFVDYSTIQKKFPNIDIILIRNVFINCLSNSGYFINDYSLTNLVLHTAIAIDRILNNNIYLQRPQNNPWINAHVYKITKEAVNQFEEYFDIEYTDIEKYELALLIMSRATPVDFEKLEDTNVSKYIKEEYIVLAKDILNEIKLTYGISLDEEKPLNCFALHLQSLFVRSNNNNLNKNPLTNTIKSSCPFFFDAAVHISSLINKKTGITITDDEISYIAIHLGFMIGEKKAVQNKIATVVYCPRYYDAVQQLIKKINDTFANNLTIINVVTSEDQFNNSKNTDLIISILPINNSISFRNVQVSLFFTEQDIQKIRVAIQDINKSKLKQAFEKNLRKLFPDSLFMKAEYFSSPFQCIKYMYNKLDEYGYAYDNLLNEIIERETMSSTSFGSFAIPHSIYMKSKQTVISVMIVDKPISWNKNNVNLVIMMCFNDKDKNLFQSIYETISSILIEKDKVSELTKCNTYDKFINTIINFIE